MRRTSFANPRRDTRPVEFHVLREFALVPFRFTPDDRTLSIEHVGDIVRTWTRHSKPFRAHVSTELFGQLAQLYPSTTKLLRERMLRTGTTVLEEIQQLVTHTIVDTIDQEPLTHLLNDFLATLDALHSGWRESMDIDLSQSAFDALRRVLPAPITSEFGPTVEMSRVWLSACLRVIENAMYEVFHVFAIECELIESDVTVNSLRYSLEQLNVPCSECKNIHDFVYKYHDFISKGIEPQSDADSDPESRPSNDKDWVRPPERLPRDLMSMGILELVEILESMHADYADCLERKEFLVHRIRTIEMYLDRRDTERRSASPPRRPSLCVPIVRQAGAMRMPLIMAGFPNGLQAVRCSHETDKYTLCPHCRAARYCGRPMCKMSHERGCKELPVTTTSRTVQTPNNPNPRIALVPSEGVMVPSSSSINPPTLNLSPSVRGMLGSASTSSRMSTGGFSPQPTPYANSMFAREQQPAIVQAPRASTFAGPRPSSASSRRRLVTNDSFDSVRGPPHQRVPGGLTANKASNLGVALSNYRQKWTVRPESPLDKRDRLNARRPATR
eukprot:TRINITY_DN27754_c0_g1_i1.p1 TRINITY_DN27754_c0_g1~~TRINITY_DN27754_c0_g1_i1.p1  ORF type:complete len:558 (+),score=68.78 TRINITY_DN27754_c0_g1_i1:168-1841(+)